MVITMLEAQVAPENAAKLESEFNQAIKEIDPGLRSNPFGPFFQRCGPLEDRDVVGEFAKPWTPCARPPKRPGES